MLKKIAVVVMSLGCALQAQAFDKNQINLKNDFWGTWSVYNAKSQCTETYQFTKPNQVTYSTKQKKMTGDFAVIRNTDANILDLLTLEIKNDNKKAGCAGQSVDYTKAKISLTLKWISARTAELCTDREGKKCTGLYLIKQK